MSKPLRTPNNLINFQVTRPSANNQHSTRAQKTGTDTNKMAPSWAIPVGVLTGLCVAGLLFICWWFPRTWRKGEAAEVKEFELAHGRVDEDGNRIARPKITFEEALERARADVRANKGGVRVVY